MAEITRWLRAGEAVLVVANNIADAGNLDDKLAPVALRLYGEDAAILVHARFKTKDRTRIEQSILRRYEAGKAHAPGILVATGCRSIPER